MTNTTRPTRDNPLYRRTDRVERLLVTLAVLAVAAIIPIALRLAGDVRDDVRASGEREAETRSEVDAVLLEDAHRAPVPGDATATTFVADASWQTSSGQAVQGTIDASEGDRAGDTISTWVDTSGNATGPPRTGADADVSATITATGVIGGGLIVVGVAFFAIRSRLNRVRMNDWGHQWALLEPVWSGRSPSEGR